MNAILEELADLRATQRGRAGALYAYTTAMCCCCCCCSGWAGGAGQPLMAAAAKLPERPYLRPWFRVAEDGGRVLLEYGHALVTFEGRGAAPLLPALLPLLDGTRTVAEAAVALGAAAEPAVRRALELLAAHGLLTEGPPLPAAPRERCETAELLAATGPPDLSPALAAARLQAATVVVVGSALVGADVARLLRRSGVGAVVPAAWSAGAADAALAVAAPAAEELRELEGWNELLLEQRTPWLVVLPFDGRLAAVGPLYLPGESACHACFRIRRAATSDYRDELAVLERAPARLPASPSLAAAVAGLAAELALRWLACARPVRGRCDARARAGAGAGADAAPRPARAALPCLLGARAARGAAAVVRGGRGVTAALAQLVSPYTGVVRALPQFFHAPADPRLATVGADTARSAALLGTALEHLDGASGGAAPGRDAAVAAAVGEAAERYSASYAPDRSSSCASADELGPQAVAAGAFALFSARQYARPGFPFVPFDATTPVAGRTRSGSRRSSRRGCRRSSCT